jgi:hypothetical protein
MALSGVITQMDTIILVKLIFVRIDTKLLFGIIV